MKNKEYQHKRLGMSVLALLLLFPFFSSCEKVLDIEEPLERDLVLNAVPAAGRQAFVHFAYTRFFLDDNNDQPVPGAVITLRINDTVQTLDSMVRSKYFFDHILRENDSLEIDIQADGRHVHARTYVPLYPVVSNFAAAYVPTADFNYVLASFDLSDHAGRDEYYNVVVTRRDSGVRYNEWLERYDTVDTVQSTIFFVPYSDEITSSDVSSYSPLGGRIMFLDRNIDGQQYQVPLWILQRVDTTEVPPFKHEYLVEIESVTPARFRYILSASSQGGMTSFFAEQGEVYSNVEGALGIFAGSAKRRFTFDPDTIAGIPIPSGMTPPPAGFQLPADLR
ncbi:MAG: DUF4249 domain-containing protein [Bacteroidales bacterium]|nr:DUF4249 domain-containing protein [Bacteroidales bacterium]